MKTLSYLDCVHNTFDWYRGVSDFIILASGSFLRSYVVTPSHTYRISSAWSSDGVYYEFTVSYYGSRNIISRFIGRTPEQAYSKFKRIFNV